MRPWTNGSEPEDLALAEGGVGGVLLRIPTVARKQMMQDGTAYATIWRRREPGMDVSTFNHRLSITVSGDDATAIII